MAIDVETKVGIVRGTYGPELADKIEGLLLCGQSSGCSNCSEAMEELSQVIPGLAGMDAERLRIMSGDFFVTLIGATNVEKGNTIQNDGFINDCWELAPNIGRANLNAILYGPPGTGKTRFAFSCAKPGQEVFSVTCTEEMSSATLVGYFIVAAGGVFQWNDGPAIRAWNPNGEKGGLLVLNEIDQIRGDALPTLHFLLDDPELAKITLANGQTVKPAPGFRCIATTNMPADDLPPAVQDRFPIRVFVDRPSDEAISVLNPSIQEATKGSYSDPDRLNFTYREAAAFSDMIRADIPMRVAASMIWGAKAPGILEGIIQAGDKDTSI